MFGWIEALDWVGFGLGWTGLNSIVLSCVGWLDLIWIGLD